GGRAVSACRPSIAPVQSHAAVIKRNGDEGVRTLDLCIANAPLSQLSYVPVTRFRMPVLSYCQITPCGARTVTRGRSDPVSVRPIVAIAEELTTAYGGGDLRGIVTWDGA